MASSTSVLSEDQLLCPICLDVFTDPVTIPCGHNFCMICLKEVLNSRLHSQCPLCKAYFHQGQTLCVNTFISALAAPCKKSVQVKSQVLCEFCCEEKCAAVKSCLICMSSYCKTHLEPHERVSSLKKHKLIDPVENLEDYICQKNKRPLELFCRDDQTCVCQLCAETDHKTHNTVPLEGESREKKVYPSLCSPPHTRDWTDRTINTRLSVETLRRDLFQLQDILRQEMEEIDATELRRIQQYAVDVTLDPDMAHPKLILSDDGKQVTYGDSRQNLPDNPERFYYCGYVLGKEGFSSGRFYYEVQVRGKTKWDLGLVKESIDREVEVTADPKNGYWGVWLRNNSEYKALDSPPVSLTLKQAPQKVGVFVDYEEGLISFYDVDAMSHIYSFTGQTFTEKLYPCFCPCHNDEGKNSAPLIICSAHTELFFSSFSEDRWSG